MHHLGYVGQLFQIEIRQLKKPQVLELIAQVTFTKKEKLLNISQKYNK